MDGEWYYSPDHRQLCRLIEVHTLWGETTCRVWLPGSDSVVCIPASRVKSLGNAGTGSPDIIAYVVIVDEAHRLRGSADQVARFKLGQGLSEAAPYFLLLSATPHQGKTDAFHRLMSLIDAQEFPDVGSVTRERVQPHVIRTEKRLAIDAEGKPLFKPRRTEIGPVSWEERHRDQQLLYEAVTEYVREGYNQAMREKRSTIGFLMILMQRLVVSSTSAIRTTLERRLDALATPQEQLTMFPLPSEEEWADLDSQEQIDMLLGIRLKALKNERAEVKLLLDAAARCEQAGPDAKAEALLDWLYRLQSAEGDTELKALVFTEFVPTQEILQRFLTERGFSVVCLNGSMDMDARKRAQEAFAHEVRILISTDAGGEGLNLQESRLRLCGPTQDHRADRPAASAQLPPCPSRSRGESLSATTRRKSPGLSRDGGLAHDSRGGRWR